MGSRRSLSDQHDTLRQAWARSLVDAVIDVAPLDLVAAVVAAVADAVAADGARDAKLIALGNVDLVQGRAPAGGWADPWLPGLVHEQAVSAASRSARGAWYTPQRVVEGLVQFALGPTGEGWTPFVVDPTCGGGAFLLAALNRLSASGVEPAAAVAQVAGRDIDPGAVAVSRWTVQLWAAARGVVVADDEVDVAVGDALDGPAEHWPPVRLVIGNPPFATPLRSGAIDDRAARFRTENQELLGPYADVAAMHLLAAARGVDPGSVVALIQPQSVLSGRDTTALRDHLSSVAPLHALWAAREAVFDAGVRACAVVLHPGGLPAARPRLATGPDVVPVNTDHSAATETSSSSETDSPAPAWSALAAQALGAPTLPASMGLAGGDAPVGRLGELVEATAGFRDEYYGLVEACREWVDEEAEPPNRLLTVGAVEPLSTRWGTGTLTLGRRRWTRPTAELDVLSPRVRGWTERQMVPKLVVATQSRVLEPVIDRTGRLIPITPLLALHANTTDLDRVAAVLLAPPVVAWAWQRWFGAAMAVDALKLAARQIGELPLPTDSGAWEEATAIIAALGDQENTVPEQGWAVAADVAAVMTRAYGAAETVTDWWLERAGRHANSTAADPAAR